MKDIKIGAEAKYIGVEPNWSNFDPSKVDDNECLIVSAYNWYNYAVSDKDKNKIVTDFISSRMPTKVAGGAIRAINALDHWEIPNWLMSLCRMQLRGLVLTDARRTSFDNKLQDIIRLGAATLEANAIKPSNAVVVSVQDNIRLSALDKSADIDDQLDKVFRDPKHTFNCYDWLSFKKIGPMIAMRLGDIYRSDLEEIDQALSKSDPQVVEGYSSYSKKHLTAIRNFYQALIVDCETWGRNQKKKPKARKKSIKSADHHVRKLKYMKEFPELKLVSIDPSKIVGANEVWVFNAKYRKLQHYVATDRGGLQVKGTSLQNFHETDSTAKTLRKPKEVLPDIMTGSSKAAIRVFNDIRSTAAKCNGRIGESSIILRAI